VVARADSDGSKNGSYSASALNGPIAVNPSSLGSSMVDPVTAAAAAAAADTGKASKPVDRSKGLWTRCDKCGVILYIKHLKVRWQAGTLDTPATSKNTHCVIYVSGYGYSQGSRLRHCHVLADEHNAVRILCYVHSHSVTVCMNAKMDKLG
jgi:hypothetical protein